MRFSKVVYFVVIVVFIFSSCKKEYSCEKCITAASRKGNVVFYTVGGCVNGKPITLFVDGELYMTFDVAVSRPECSTPGITAVALTAGIHSWRAICDSV